MLTYTYQQINVVTYYWVAPAADLVLRLRLLPLLLEPEPRLPGCAPHFCHEDFNCQQLGRLNLNLRRHEERLALLLGLASYWAIISHKHH